MLDSVTGFRLVRLINLKCDDVIRVTTGSMLGMDYNLLGVSDGFATVTALTHCDMIGV